MSLESVVLDGVKNTCGFLEESPGVRSSARLFGAVMTACIIALTVAIVIVALKYPEHAAGIAGAIGPSIVGLAGGVWGAMRERN